jgi:hypothetical protein
MKKSAAYVIAATLLAFGIAHAQATKEPGDTEEPLAPGNIRITPIDLFPGDLKRLQPHLEMDGACFKFEYDGHKKSVRLVLQILEKGKREISATMFLKPFEGPSSGEASVSIRSVKDAQGQSAWYIIGRVVQNEAHGTSSSMQYMPRTLPANAHGSSGQSIPDVSVFDADDEVPLWCKVRSAGPIRVSGPMDEMAKEADFAVLLKLVPDDPEGK